MKKRIPFSKTKKAKRIREKYRDELFQMFTESLIKMGWTKEEAIEEAKELLGQFTLKAITASC